MSDKPCDCGSCFKCCDGYVQDPQNPNRYVNLATGKERSIEKKEPKINLFLIWLLIALFATYYSNNSQTQTNSNQENQRK
jgi:hypothetical protein